MTKRVHPVVVVMALFVALVVIALVFQRRTETPEPMAASPGMDMTGMGGGRGGGMRGGGMRGGGGGGDRMGRGGRRGGAPQAGEAGTPGARPDAELGIGFSVSREPQGFKIDKFEGTPNPSPLKIMGLREGDVITACNGKSQQIRGALLGAIQDLQAKGTPVELTINRGGKSMAITWREKLPAAAVPAATPGQANPSAGGRRGG